MLKKEIYYLIIFLVLVCFIYYSPRFSYSSKAETVLNENCFSNKDLPNISYCLREELKKWYNYNLSNINKELSLKELKEQGGVCWHYSKYFLDLFKNSSFYAEEITFPTGNLTSHRITLVSSEDSYCILDQITSHCFKVENNITLLQELGTSLNETIYIQEIENSS